MRPPFPAARGGNSGGITSRSDEVDGLRIHSRVFPGRPGAPTIVLVHGFGVSGRYLVPTARLLPPRLTALVPDLPGFGRSPRPGSRPALAELVRVLGRWHETLGLERCAFLANSFGCQLVVELAATRSELVSALVLVGPTVDRHARSLPRQLARLAVDTLREPVSLWPLIVRDYATFAARGGMPLTRDLLADRLEERLPRVEQPTLVVRGSRDAIVSQEWAEEVRALLPRGRLAVVDGSPHAVNYAAPEALVRLVLDLVGPAAAEAR